MIKLLKTMYTNLTSVRLVRVLSAAVFHLLPVQAPAVSQHHRLHGEIRLQDRSQEPP